MELFDCFSITRHESNSLSNQPLLNAVILYIQDMRLLLSLLLNSDGRIIYIEMAKPGVTPLEDSQEPLVRQRCGICRSNKMRCQISGTNQFAFD